MLRFDVGASRCASLNMWKCKWVLRDPVQGNSAEWDVWVKAVVNCLLVSFEMKSLTYICNVWRLLHVRLKNEKTHMCRGFNPLCSLSDEYRDSCFCFQKKKTLVLISVRCQTLKYNCLVTQWMHMSEILMHFTLVFIFSGDEKVKHYYYSYWWKLIWTSPWCKILNFSACTIYSMCILQIM